MQRTSRSGRDEMMDRRTRRPGRQPPSRTFRRGRLHPHHPQELRRLGQREAERQGRAIWPPNPLNRPRSSLNKLNPTTSRTTNLPSPWGRNLFLFDSALGPSSTFDFRLLPFVDAFCPCSMSDIRRICIARFAQGWYRFAAVLSKVRGGVTFGASRFRTSEQPCFTHPGIHP